MSEAAPERWQPRNITAIPTSRRSLEEVADQAREKGYAEGLAKGQAEAKKQCEQTASELAALWKSMEKPLAHQDAQVSEHLLSLVVAVSKSVLQQELTTSPDFIQRTLDEALACLADSETPLAITLNPTDKALVERLLEEKRITAELIADTAMLRGGCRLVRGHALVDASIESRVASLVEQFAGGEGSSTSNGPETEVLDADRIKSIAERFSDDSND